MAAILGSMLGTGVYQTPEETSWLGYNRGQQDQAGRENQRNIAQIGADASMYPAKLAQERFNTVFPWLQGQFSSVGGGAPGGSPVGKQPNITVGGVWNPGQVQQQVNTSRANTDQSAASQMQNQTRQVASQGFGSNSPILAALKGQTLGNALQTNVGNETNIRQNAAQQNASHLLGTQQAAEGQYASRQAEDIKRRQTGAQMYSALLSSLAGMV